MYCTLLIYDSLKGSLIKLIFQKCVLDEFHLMLHTHWIGEKPSRCKSFITIWPLSQSASLSVSSLFTNVSLSLLFGSHIVTLSDLWPMSKSLVIFVAVLNVAPWAPYQHHNKNSWEQLSMGFNSSLTTEVKISHNVSKWKWLQKSYSVITNCLPFLPVFPN